MNFPGLGSMLPNRRRRGANIEPIMGERCLFAGISEENLLLTFTQSCIMRFLFR